MGETAIDRNPDMFRGTVDILILEALTLRRRHGFGIARWLEEVTSDATSDPQTGHGQSRLIRHEPGSREAL